ncbi:MAG TPA: RHS repeat-associated core domain-containing protein [Candidatus Dormibacteraeota bacterium]|nr:RHS repeat-associated core domain-containing protein [Candidatus Dormibacteraeota bacterium]
MRVSSSTGDTAYAPMPGGGASIWSPSGFYYRHGDWLGSSRFASTQSRTVYYDVAYAPFGQPYNATGTADADFTGKDQQTVSGLYDFPAREYNGLEGRWASPDPAGLAAVNPADPQTWNRYAYVRNSPLVLTDPTGLIGTIVSPPAIGCIELPAFCQLQSELFSLSGDFGVLDSGGGPDDPIGFSLPPTPWCNPWFLSGCFGGPTCEVISGPGCGGNSGSTGSGPTPPTVSGPTPPTVSGNQPQTPAQADKQCLSNQYNSPFGKAVKFGSPLQMIPGWGQNPKGAAEEWFGFGALKYAYFKIAGGGAQSLYAAGESSTFAEVFEPALTKAGLVLLGAAAASDIAIHETCGETSYTPGVTFGGPSPW